MYLPISKRMYAIDGLLSDSQAVGDYCDCFRLRAEMNCVNLCLQQDNCFLKAAYATI